MEEGVSPSLAREGVSGTFLLPAYSFLVSVPFTREHGSLCERNFSGGLNLPDIVIYVFQISTAQGQHTRKGVIPSLPLKRVSYKGAFIPGSKRVSGDANGTSNAADEFRDISSKLQSTTCLSSRSVPSECGVNSISSFLDLGDINSKSHAPGSFLLLRINTRKDPNVTGAVFPTQASRIRLAKSGVLDLGLSVQMESVFCDPGPRCNGGLRSGTRRGDPAKPIAMCGTSPATVISSKDVLATTAIGKDTIYGFDPLFQSAQLGSDDIRAPVTLQTTDQHRECSGMFVRRSASRSGSFIWFLDLVPSSAAETTLREHGSLDLVPSFFDEVRIGAIRLFLQMKLVIHAVGGDSGSDIGPSFSHVVGGGSGVGNRFPLGFAPRCLVQFSSMVGSRTHRMEHVEEGDHRIGAARHKMELPSAVSIFSPLVVFPATAAAVVGKRFQFSILFWAFQRVELVMVDDPDAKSAFLQFFAHNSPDFVQQGS